MRYTIVADIDEGVRGDGTARTPEQIIKFLQLTLQQALTKADCVINKVDVKQNTSSKSGAKPGSPGGPGRKPINRPKVEAWIREHITAGPSTQGTVGLEGVDINGMPKVLPNRIFMHRLTQPEPIGVGLSMIAVQKVLSELEVEGYCERGFAAGAPFYELIRPLEEPGKVGIRGRAIDEEPDSNPRTPHYVEAVELDFTDVEEED